MNARLHGKEDKEIKVDERRHEKSCHFLNFI